MKISQSCIWTFQSISLGFIRVFRCEIKICSFYPSWSIPTRWATKAIRSLEHDTILIKDSETFDDDDCIIRKGFDVYPQNIWTADMRSGREGMREAVNFFSPFSFKIMKEREMSSRRKSWRRKYHQMMVELWLRMLPVCDSSAGVVNARREARQRNWTPQRFNIFWGERHWFWCTSISGMCGCVLTWHYAVVERTFLDVESHLYLLTKALVGHTDCHLEKGS